jgi:hypothetical protein
MRRVGLGGAARGVDARDAQASAGPGRLVGLPRARVHGQVGVGGVPDARGQARALVRASIPASSLRSTSLRRTRAQRPAEVRRAEGLARARPATTSTSVGASP